MARLAAATAPLADGAENEDATDLLADDAVGLERAITDTFCSCDRSNETASLPPV